MYLFEGTVWRNYLTERLKRLQHSGFGAEIRELILEDPEAAGIVISEVCCLSELKFNGSRHPCEERLAGDDLSAIGYLRLYRSRQSLRVYFTVIEGTIWMLHFESKRRTDLSDGTVRLLKSRLLDVKVLAARSGDHE